jgi:hypothetical protein
VSDALPPDGEEAHDEPRGGYHHIALGRAVALLAVAIVVGVILLDYGTRPTVSSTATTTTLPTTSTTHAPATTTTTTPIVRSSVKVLVANGTTTNGLAAHVSQELQAQGWSTLPPTDTTAPVSASGVYYAAGQQAAAALVASELGLRASVVQPLTTSVPVSGTSGVEVVAVAGPDLAGTSTTT